MEKLTVIKVGGAVVEDPEALSSFLDRFSAIGGNLILVHGGGREATRTASALGIESRMIEGRRVTDAAMLEIVTMVYAGKVNKGIVSGLRGRGCRAIGLTGADLNCITSVRKPVAEVDYGYVGVVKSVDAATFGALLGMEAIPVVSPITCDDGGQLLNTNADSLASAIAVGMSGMYDVELVFCFEKKGVLLNPDDDDSVIAHLDSAGYENFKKDGVVSGGMIPKLDGAFDALAKGVRSVRITNAVTLNGYSGTTISL